MPRALLTMGLPTMVGMMINALYNLVDAYFVGGLEPARWAQSPWPFPWVRWLWDWGCCLETAAPPPSPGFWAAETREAAGRAASTALYSSLLVGAVMIACAVIFLRPILTLLGATEHSSLRPDLRWHLRGLIHLQHL